MREKRRTRRRRCWLMNGPVETGKRTPHGHRLRFSWRRSTAKLSTCQNPTSKLWGRRGPDGIDRRALAADGRSRNRVRGGTPPRAFTGASALFITLFRRPVSQPRLQSVFRRSGVPMQSKRRMNANEREWDRPGCLQCAGPIRSSTGSRSPRTFAGRSPGRQSRERITRLIHRVY
jgi:hypothetical protein